MGRTLLTTDSDQTRRLGEKIGRLLNKGDVLALTGPLGAGKTVLAKGVARGLGVVEEVTSPSFNIVIEYRGRAPFYHIDFYRLAAQSEADDVGMDEYIYGNGVAVLEWAERFPKLLPKRRLDVEIKFGKEDNERVLELTPFGDKMIELVGELSVEGGSGV